MQHRRTPYRESTAMASIHNHIISDPPVRAPRDIAHMPGPKGIPLFGNARQVDRGRFHASLEQWAETFGPFYRMHMAGRRFVVVSDADAIAALLRDRPGKMRRSSRMANLVEEGGFAGVFTAEGASWLKQRRLVMHSLTPQVIERFLPKLEGMTQRLERRWRRLVDNGAQPDMLRDLKAYTMDVTVAMTFGVDMNSLDDEAGMLQQDVDFILKRIGARLTSPFPYWRIFKRKQDRQADACIARMRESVNGFIADARMRLEADPALRTRPGNLLESMVIACDAPGSEFTDEEVFGNAMTMIFAGEDTTSHTLAWLLDFLARDQPAADAIACEAEAAFDGRGSAGTIAVLDHLHGIDRAIKEAMRLKPVAPLIPLETNEPITAGGFLIPAGTIVLCLTRCADRRLGHWQDPDAFRPSRWQDSQGAEKDKGLSQRTPGFGGGPRFCPGRYLALTEMKMVVSMLTRSFSIEPVKGAAPVEERFTFTMTPSHLPIQLARKTTLK